jgi:c-di-GMP-binding flagellar brake protein YcgR
VEYFQQATPGSCSLDWLNIEETHEKILCNSIWDELREEREQREADELDVT